MKTDNMEQAAGSRGISIIEADVAIHDGIIEGNILKMFRQRQIEDGYLCR
jgi:hypothetical protein